MGRELHDDHTVVRYVGQAKIDGEIVSGTAFSLRDTEPGVTVQLLEAFGVTEREEQLGEVRKILRVEVRESGRLAELNVGRVHRTIQPTGTTVKFVKTPKPAENQFPPDPSHCDIVPSDRAKYYLVANYIAKSVVQLHRAIASTDTVDTTDSKTISE
jgi:hypothetical protein